MAVSVFILPTRAKVADFDTARALGVSPRTVKAWRLREREPSRDMLRALVALRRERAERAIADAQAELHRINEEARLAGLVLAPRVRGNVAAVRLGGSTGETLRRPRRRADPTRDAAESAS